MAIQKELPRSRLTLTYRTTVNGQPENVNLPLRLLILGDFSKGKSKDAAKDLESRPLRSLKGNNLGSVMREMGMTLTLSGVPSSLAEDATIPVELPIDDIRSFTPDEIVKHVPQLRALLLMRQLLLELQGQIDNQSALRKSIQSLFSTAGGLDQLKKELGDFAALKLPPRSSAQPTGAAAAATLPSAK